MLPNGPIPRAIGTALSRIIVPLWILTGVVFKLNAGAPSTLPLTLTMPARDLGIPLGTLLYTLIGLEIFAVLVMVLLPRLARPMAIFMLASFCAILIGEMIRGAESCGCFGGGMTIQPRTMLVADLLLLVGVILFRPAAGPGTAGASSVLSARTGGIAAGALAGGLAMSFGIGTMLHGGERPQDALVDETADVEGAERDPTINPSPRNLPHFWYARDIETWVGRPWRELELFQFMPRWPKDMDEGKRYVVFFSRTCGHCQDMFELDFIVPLAAPVTAIEIPHSERQLISPDALFEPVADAVTELLALPLGPNWNMIQAPLAMRIENGIVTCAREQDHRRCMEIE
jgi:hypothetical protein